MNITLRNFHMDDIPALVPLRAAVEEMDHLGFITTEEGIRTRHISPALDPERNSFVAVTPHGQIVGNAWLMLRHGIGEDVFALNGMVHPAWRGQGIGRRLLDTIIARARDRKSESTSHCIWLQSPDVPDTPVDGGRIALYESNEFELVRWELDMRRELPGLGKVAPVIPIVQAPPGIQLHKWRPGVDDEAVGWLLNEAFRDSWGYTQIVMEEWLRYVRSGLLNLEHCVLAWSREAADERMVGACVNRCDDDTFRRRGRRELYVDDLAVLREYRKRGIATALLAWTMNRADHLGMQSVGLGADAENITGAVRLYKRMGFEVMGKMRVYRKGL
jgi:ribosomal protein S18 acetylase RimI-like enzyme